MKEKEELKKKLNNLTSEEFIKYLIKTGWCVRDVWETSINNNWSDKDIIKELEFIKKMEL